MRSSRGDDDVTLLQELPQTLALRAFAEGHAAGDARFHEHLSQGHALHQSPALGLPYDYPMVAPSYAAQRSAMAKQAGLGRKSKKVDELQAAADAQAAAAGAEAKRTRKKADPDAEG
jgi:hypothetical protein